MFTEQSGALIPLAVALAVGLIIGFERGWYTQVGSGRGKEPELGSEAPSVAGIRTFALTGLLGGVATLLAETHPLVLVAALVLLGGLLVVGYVFTTRATGDYGATTEIALALTFVLGAFAVSGYMLEAVAVSVVVAVILGFKTEIHATVGRLDRRELQASLQLLVIVLVVLPLLPDQAMGPWNSLNPRKLGLLMMLIASIGFVGYFAVRIIGPRAGLLLTALFGGLASSTALTVTFARLARARGARHALLGAGIALACGTMAPRLLFEVAVVNPALVPPLLPGMIALAVVPLVAAFWVARHSSAKGKVENVGVDNPLEIRQALIITVLLAIIFMLSHGAEAVLGERGIYTLAVLSGIADVDAIGLALAQQAKGSLADDVAARGILLAALSNTAAKAAIAAVIGGRELAKWATSIMLVALAAGTVALIFM